MTNVFSLYSLVSLSIPSFSYNLTCFPLFISYHQSLFSPFCLLPNLKMALLSLITKLRNSLLTLAENLYTSEGRGPEIVENTVPEDSLYRRVMEITIARRDAEHEFIAAIKSSKVSGNLVLKSIPSFTFSVLPPDIIFLVISALPVHSQACLALTERYLYSVLKSCLKSESLHLPEEYRSYIRQPLAYLPERWVFLTLLETDLFPRWLVCSCCSILHPAHDFPPEELRVRSHRRRCTIEAPMIHGPSRFVKDCSVCSKLHPAHDFLPEELHKRAHRREGTNEAPRGMDRRPSGVVEVCPCIKLSARGKNKLEKNLQIFLGLSGEKKDEQLGSSNSISGLCPPARDKFWWHECRKTYRDVELTTKVRPSLKPDGELFLTTQYEYDKPHFESSLPLWCCPHQTLDLWVKQDFQPTRTRPGDYACYFRYPDSCCRHCNTQLFDVVVNNRLEGGKIRYSVCTERSLGDLEWHSQLVEASYESDRANSLQWAYAYIHQQAPRWAPLPRTIRYTTPLPDQRGLTLFRRRRSQ